MFIWCVSFAIILALVCAYLLWKKRRTLCGWGFTDHHAQSEGDSAGSCYAPPHYSRCNSFHQPPPPYTEVTSKPDLYPLVFTCNSDNAKTGSSYLMVQYFRNYIVRPVGSLSAASTVDSLSSSFICNINEANTLIPPPYSRAASPDIGLSSHFHQQHMIPRSASQLVCTSVGANGSVKNAGMHDMGNGGIVAQHLYQGHQSRGPHFTVVALNGSLGGSQSGIDIENAVNSSISYSTILQASVGENFNLIEDTVGNNNHCTKSDIANRNSSGSGSNRSIGCGSNVSAGCIPKDFVQSQNDQHFRYINSSNSNISDIFTNNNSMGAYTNTNTGTGIKSLDIGSFDDMVHTNSTDLPNATNSFCTSDQPNNEHQTHASFNNAHFKSRPLHRTSTNPTQFSVESTILRPTYKSCDSVANTFTVPDGINALAQAEFKDLHVLKQNLETCCHILKQKHQQYVQPQQTTINGIDSPLFRHNELVEKYITDELRDYAAAAVNYSTLSSITNICTPSSPPQATSPTSEVREILEQIRQLRDEISYEDMLLHMAAPLCNTPNTTASSSSELSKNKNSRLQRKAHRNSVTCCDISPTSTVLSPSNTKFSKTTVCLDTSSPDKGTTTVITKTAQNNKLSDSKEIGNVTKRPLTLHQNKKKLFTPKPSKAFYIPMIPNLTTTSANRGFLKSPVNSVGSNSFFSGKGSRVRKIWVSRSAPTTPGTALPPNRLSDNSPLLTEHDEDQESEPNDNIE